MDNSKAGLTGSNTSRNPETFATGPRDRMLHDGSMQFRLVDGGPTIQTVLRDYLASDPLIWLRIEAQLVAHCPRRNSDVSSTRVGFAGLAGLARRGGVKLCSGRQQ
jgi:hypothetical protein